LVSPPLVYFIPSPSSIPSFLILTATPPNGFYSLSLHDALPIWPSRSGPSSSASSRCATSARPSSRRPPRRASSADAVHQYRRLEDRKSTRLNSSHRTTSYAVFCLKKKNKQHTGR